MNILFCIKEMSNFYVPVFFLGGNHYFYSLLSVLFHHDNTVYKFVGGSFVDSGLYIKPKNERKVEGFFSPDFCYNLCCWFFFFFFRLFTRFLVVQANKQQWWQRRWQWQQLRQYGVVIVVVVVVVYRYYNKPLANCLFFECI